MKRAIAGLMLVLVGAVSPSQANLPNLSHNPSHSEMVRFLVAAQQVNPKLTVASIGSSLRGRQVPVVFLYNRARNPLQMKRVLILARQHGNEPAGTIAVLWMLRDLANGNHAELDRILDNVCVIIVPMVNPDGADANRRHNAAGVDLNRDWHIRSQPESQAVERLFHLWTPHCVLDLHELHPTDQGNTNTVEAPRANVINEAVASETRLLQRMVLDLWQQSGWSTQYWYYSDSSHPGLSHRHFGRHHNTVALLFESQRRGYKRELTDRALMHRVGVEAVLRYYNGSNWMPRTPRLSAAPAYGEDTLPPPLLTIPTSVDTGAMMVTDRELEDDTDHAALPVPAEEVPVDSLAGADPRPRVSLSSQYGPAPPVRIPSAPVAAPVVTPTTSQPAITVTAPNLDQPLRGQVRLLVNISGVPDLDFAAIRVGALGCYYGNQAQFEFEWDTSRHRPGSYPLLVTARRQNGVVIEREYTVTIADR